MRAQAACAQSLKAAAAQVHACPSILYFQLLRELSLAMHQLASVNGQPEITHEILQQMVAVAARIEDRRPGSAVGQIMAQPGIEVNNIEHKSFLLLFFKKEVLSFLPLRSRSEERTKRLLCPSPRAGNLIKFVIEFFVRAQQNESTTPQGTDEIAKAIVKDAR